jgi:hypothetical protein
MLGFYFLCHPWSTFNLVEVAVLREKLVVGLFIEPFSHYDQSSSSSRRTAGAAGFLILIQCSDRRHFSETKPGPWLLVTKTGFFSRLRTDASRGQRR